MEPCVTGLSSMFIASTLRRIYYLNQSIYSGETNRVTYFSAALLRIAFGLNTSNSLHPSILIIINISGNKPITTN